MNLDWFLEEFPRNLSKNQKEIYFLKLELLSKGLRLDFELGKNNEKVPIRVRTGASSGIDLYLYNDVFINTPINEPFVKNSDLTLTMIDNHPYIINEQLGTYKVKFIPEPSFYNKKTTDGINFTRIGQLCTADRLCIGLDSSCSFWKNNEQCHFCSIELNKHRESCKKSINNICELIIAAEHDEKQPARHVYFTSGTYPPPDRGAIYYSSIIKKVKEITNKKIYVMICPPNDLKFVNMLYDAGVYEIGYNIEIFDKKISERLIPGKVHQIGRNNYIKTLKRALDLFGEIRTRSALLAGLEPIEKTLEGVELLCSLGVMPIISCFRPLNGTPLQNLLPLSSVEMAKLYFRALEIADEYGIPLGPTCIPCQNNTIAFPLPGEKYVYY